MNDGRCRRRRRKNPATHARQGETVPHVKLRGELDTQPRGERKHVTPHGSYKALGQDGLDSWRDKHADSPSTGASTRKR